MPKIWSALTCQRFGRRADLSVRQSRVQRLEERTERTLAFDGNRPPAQSADKSAHSKTPACGVRFAKPIRVHLRPSVVEKVQLRGVCFT